MKVTDSYISLLRQLLISLLLMLVYNMGFCQGIGFEFVNKNLKGELAFEYINGFIVVDVIYNHTFPLKFIFDTGASNTIIHNKDIVNLFNPDYGRTFTVYGADLSKPMYAHLVRGIHLKTQNLLAPKQDILVLEDDYFSFKEITGMEIHGILGADMFRNYTIKINYRKKTIQLFFAGTKRLKKKGYEEIDLSLQKSKPYIECPVTLSDNNTLQLKLLVDTGASTALLLNIDSDESLILPEEIVPEGLGFGIGGIMKGYVGRIPKMNFGGKNLENLVCHFQENEKTKDSLNLVFRHGLIGNYILDRFDIILDYPNKKLFLKPNKKWKRKFKYDKSGIGFIAVGIKTSRYYVKSVLEGSPADLAGVKEGDIICKLNLKPATLLSYDGINNILRGKTGKRVKIKLKRGEESVKLDFRLKDLI